ncbi:rRNA-processing protein EBP2 [Marasmius tenuissimus]|uniref:rRNA-processing protein EBP2 n=1 Tax=Marasmius tenuissimus TaxID=585030 RepID=A0ABR2ZGF0_9AGAR
MAEIKDIFMSEWMKKPSNMEVQEWHNQYGNSAVCSRCQHLKLTCFSYPVPTQPISCLTCINSDNAHVCSRRAQERDYRVRRAFNLDEETFERLVHAFFEVHKGEGGIPVLRIRENVPTLGMLNLAPPGPGSATGSGQPISAVIATPAQILAGQSGSVRHETHQQHQSQLIQGPSEPFSVSPQIMVTAQASTRIVPVPQPQLQLQPQPTSNSPLLPSNFDVLSSHISSELDRAKAAQQGLVDHNNLLSSQIDALRTQSERLRSENEGLRREQRIWESNVARAQETARRLRQERDQLRIDLETIQSLHKGEYAARMSLAADLELANQEVEDLKERLRETEYRNDTLKLKVEKMSIRSAEMEASQEILVKLTGGMVELEEELQHTRYERDQALEDVKVRDEVLQREREEHKREIEGVQQVQEGLKRKLDQVDKTTKGEQDRLSRVWTGALAGALTSMEGLQKNLDDERNRTKNLIQYCKRNHKYLQDILHNMRNGRSLINDRPMLRHTVVEMCDEWGSKLVCLSDKMERAVDKILASTPDSQTVLNSTGTDSERPSKRARIEETA